MYFIFRNVDEKVEEKDLTPEEILQKERNAKRRRVKYKSVHTGRNKSYTEVMREVINNQMDLYQEHLTSLARQPEIPKEYTENRSDEIHIEKYTEIPFLEETVDKNDKTINDRVSSIESCHGHHSEKNYHSERDRPKERSHNKEHSRRREDDRDRHRSRRRSRDTHHAKRRRSHLRNGYNRNNDSHRRSERERRH